MFRKMMILSLYDYVKKIIDTFRARVLADTGIFEADSCIDTQLRTFNNIGLLDKASIVVTPNAYKTSKLYSVVPNDGSGDMTVTRATSATRVNASGLIETVGNNIARLDYSNGSCPSILVEPQRTNLVFPSATLTTQTRTVTAVAHTLSFYGTGSVTLSGVATGTLNGIGNRVSLTFTPTAGSLVITVTGSVIMAQLEAGSTATSYIPTVSSAVTRNADLISKTGVSSLIGQTEGTIFIDFIGVSQSNVYFSVGQSLNNVILFGLNPSGLLNARITGIWPNIIINIGAFNYVANTRYKIAFTYSSVECIISVNGVSQKTIGFAGFPTTPNRIGFDNTSPGSGILSGLVKNTLIFKNSISELELNNLTSL